MRVLRCLARWARKLTPTLVWRGVIIKADVWGGLHNDNVIIRGVVFHQAPGDPNPRILINDEMMVVRFEDELL